MHENRLSLARSLWPVSIDKLLQLIIFAVLDFLFFGGKKMWGCSTPHTRKRKKTHSEADKNLETMVDRTQCNFRSILCMNEFLQKEKKFSRMHRKIKRENITPKVSMSSFDASSGIFTNRSHERERRGGREAIKIFELNHLRPLPRPTFFSMETAVDSLPLFLELWIEFCCLDCLIGLV